MDNTKIIHPPNINQIVRSLEEERDVLQWTIHQRDIEIERLQKKCADQQKAMINVGIWGKRKHRQARDFLEMFLNGRR